MSINNRGSRGSSTGSRGSSSSSSTPHGCVKKRSNKKLGLSNCYDLWCLELCLVVVIREIPKKLHSLAQIRGFLNTPWGCTDYQLLVLSNQFQVVNTKLV